MTCLHFNIHVVGRHVRPTRCLGRSVSHSGSQSVRCPLYAHLSKKTPPECNPAAGVGHGVTWFACHSSHRCLSPAAGHGDSGRGSERQIQKTGRSEHATPPRFTLCRRLAHGAATHNPYTTNICASPRIRRLPTLLIVNKIPSLPLRTCAAACPPITHTQTA